MSDLEHIDNVGKYTDAIFFNSGFETLPRIFETEHKEILPKIYGKRYKECSFNREKYEIQVKTYSDEITLDFGAFCHTYLDWLVNTNLLDRITVAIARDRQSKKVILRDIYELADKYIKVMNNKPSDYNYYGIPIVNRFLNETFIGRYPKHTFLAVENKKKNEVAHSLKLIKDYQGKWLEVVYHKFIKVGYLDKETKLKDFNGIFYRNENVTIKWTGKIKLLGAFLASINNLIENQRGHLIRVTEVFTDAEGKNVKYDSIASAKNQAHTDKEAIKLFDDFLNDNIPTLK